jgi:maltose-binding protein MalE
LIIDPEANTASTTDISGLTTANAKWSGGVLAPNGKIYGMPFDSSSVLIIDPETDEANITDISGLTTDMGKWSGGVLAPNGKIYGIPFNSDSVLKINTGLPKLPPWMLQAYFNKF